MELLSLLTVPHTNAGRAHLISWCSSLPTSHVGLNFPPFPLPSMNGPLGIFLKLLNGPKAHPTFQQSPIRSQRPMILSSVPNTVLIYRYFQWRPVKVEHPPRTDSYTPLQLNNGLCLELTVWRKVVSPSVLPVLGCRRMTPRVEHISHTPGLFMNLLEITPIS